MVHGPLWLQAPLLPAVRLRFSVGQWHDCWQINVVFHLFIRVLLSSYLDRPAPLKLLTCFVSCMFYRVLFFYWAPENKPWSRVTRLGSTGFQLQVPLDRQQLILASMLHEPSPYLQEFCFRGRSLLCLMRALGCGDFIMTTRLIVKWGSGRRLCLGSTSKWPHSDLWRCLSVLFNLRKHWEKPKVTAESDVRPLVLDSMWS